MPKVVDHEARRAEIAAAVWRVAADRGLAAASLREVAAEAGWSLGSLRHYFATRDELLLFAFRLVAERGGARIAAAEGAGGAPREVLRRVLLETLPLDEDRRVECSVWFAFLAHADASPVLRAERETVYATLLAALAARLAPLTGSPEAAALLWAAVDGIALQGLAAPEVMTPARQEAALDAQLALLLGP